MVRAEGIWEGTATQLLAELKEDVTPDYSQLRDRAWPRQANQLARQLMRLAPALREIPIHIEWKREPGGARRLIHVATP